jgi:hypothetical protein
MNNISSLTHQIGQMGLSIEEKNVELRLKDNKITQ